MARRPGPDNGPPIDRAGIGERDVPTFDHPFDRYDRLPPFDRPPLPYDHPFDLPPLPRRPFDRLPYDRPPPPIYDLPPYDRYYLDDPLRPRLPPSLVSYTEFIIKRKILLEKFLWWF